VPVGREAPIRKRARRGRSKATSGTMRAPAWTRDLAAVITSQRGLSLQDERQRGLKQVLAGGTGLSLLAQCSRLRCVEYFEHLCRSGNSRERPPARCMQCHVARDVGRGHAGPAPQQACGRHLQHLCLNCQAIQRQAYLISTCSNHPGHGEAVRATRVGHLSRMPRTSAKWCIVLKSHRS